MAHFTKLLVVLLSFISFKDSVAQTKSSFEEAAQRVIDDKMLAGFSVAVFDGQSVLYSNGFGFSDLENKEVYNADTRQIIASISKLVIATSIMKAQEMGLLKLDDDINEYLPFDVRNPNYPDEPITIRQLANHTSSISYSHAISDDYAFSRLDLTLAEFCKNYFDVEGEWYSKNNYGNYKPGERFDYSNIAASLAAYIVEYKTGVSFKQFCEQHIFEPLGLENTSWFDSENDRKSCSKLYELNHKEKSFDEIEARPIGIYPVRDLTTTVSDLAKLSQLVLNNGSYNDKEIISAASIEEMLESTVSSKVEGLQSSGQGVFWIMDKNQLGVPAKVIGHSGGDAGIFTMLWINPKSGKGYIFLSNTGQIEENVGAMIYLWRALNKFGKSLD